MKRIFLFFLLAFSCLPVRSHTYTADILGYRFEDSSLNDVSGVYEKVVAIYPSLDEHRVPEKGTPRLRKSENKTGVFFISVLLLFVFAGVRLMFAHQFSGSFALLQNMNDKRKAQTENDNISSLSFYTLYLITVGYLTFCFLTEYNKMFVQLPTLAAILLCIGLVTVLYLLKMAAMYLLAWTFDKKGSLSQYFLQVSVIYKAAAIVLFPLSIIILVSSDSMAVPLLKAGIFLFFLAMLFRYIRNLSLIKKLLSVHFFHFFAYLCAFEIMPLLLLFKWIR